jgi:hypothetical protein
MGGDAGRRSAAGTVDAGSAAAAPPAGRILRFVSSAPGEAPPDRRIVVTDSAWTAPPPADGGERAAAAPIGLRDVAARVLASRDLIAETTGLLDRWVAESGVVEALTVDGTSYWHYYRLRQWMWLQEQLLWVAIAADLLRDPAPTGVEAADGVDAGLVDALRLVGEQRGIPVSIEGASPAPAPAGGRTPSATTTKETAEPRDARNRTAVWLAGRLRWLRHGTVARVSRDEVSRRRRFVRDRLQRLGRERGRLLVVLEHARQRIDTADGPRELNPYLGPIVEELSGTRLEPLELDIRCRLSDESDWQRLREPGADRMLPADAIWMGGAPWPPDDRQAAAETAADTIAGAAAPLVVDGVDLGPALAARVAADARRTLAGLGRNAVRIRRLLGRLRPAGILLADEYHRQEWLAAAAAERIPVAAVQHGLIWRGHAGYVHPNRPTELRLPDRTYVFGSWEAELLRSRSVFRSDEVVVAGSPRLDLAGDRHDNPARTGREAIRDDLGVAAGDRMVVVSGTWSTLYRRFHYPISFAAIVDRPLPGVHLVIKLHPGEPDEGPYRATIEGAARARGHEPPPITIVRSIDLYALLAAADAHVGIHSTVLTEAVWAGTPNLLIDFLPAADLLGYVAAGVARPIRDGGGLLAALDDPAAGRPDEATRRRFLDAHFEPGRASRRIADDLLAWLP